MQCFDGRRGMWIGLRVISMGEHGMRMVAPRKANEGGAISACYICGKRSWIGLRAFPSSQRSEGPPAALVHIQATQSDLQKRRFNFHLAATTSSPDVPKCRFGCRPLNTRQGWRRMLQLEGMTRSSMSAPNVGTDRGGDGVNCPLTRVSWISQSSNRFLRMMVAPPLAVEKRRAQEVVLMLYKAYCPLPMGLRPTTHAICIRPLGERRAKAYLLSARVLRVVGSERNDESRHWDQRGRQGSVACRWW